MGAPTAGTMFNPARLALRQIWRSRSFAVLTCLCLGVGVGATSAMFGAIHTLFLAPPTGVRAPERIVRFYFVRHIPDGRTIINDLTSYPGYADFRDHTRGFESVAAFQNTLISEEAAPLRRKCGVSSQPTTILKRSASRRRSDGCSRVTSEPPLRRQSPSSAMACGSADSDRVPAPWARSSPWPTGCIPALASPPAASPASTSNPSMSDCHSNWPPTT
jgi:hypothetical protein